MDELAAQLPGGVLNLANLAPRTRSAPSTHAPTPGATRTRSRHSPPPETDDGGGDDEGYKPIRRGKASKRPVAKNWQHEARKAIALGGSALRIQQVLKGLAEKVATHRKGQEA
jgi:hypothetical protein